jgi:hypothetical protein
MTSSDSFRQLTEDECPNDGAPWASIGTPGFPSNFVLDDTGSNPSSTFGYVSGARPGRHMQIAMKFVF